MSEKQQPKYDTDELIDHAEMYVQHGKENLTQVAHELVHGRFNRIPPKQQGIMITDEFLGHIAAMGPVEATDGERLSEADLMRIIKAVGATHDANVMPRANGLRFAFVILAQDVRTNHADFWLSPELRLGTEGSQGFASIDVLRGYLAGKAQMSEGEVDKAWVAKAMADVEALATSNEEWRLTGEWWQDAEYAGVDMERVVATIDRLRLADRAPKDLGKTSVDAVTTKMSVIEPGAKKAM